MNEQIQKWLDANYKNYLKKNPPMDQNDLDHILDWMKSSDAERLLPRIDRVTPPQALEMSRKWTDKLNKANKKALDIIENGKGTQLVKNLSDGYAMVKLVSETSFKKEGILMGHCVGSYFGRDSDTEIFSLRDANNEPHCTIEYTRSESRIEQIKGKANTEVIKKYQKYVIEFLNQFDFLSIYSYDIKNISSIYFGTYFFATDEMPQNLVVPKTLTIDKVNYMHTFDTLEIKGDAFLSGNRRCKKIARKLIVHGDLVIEEFHGLLKIADEVIVKGSIEVINCENFKTLGTLISCEEAFVESCDRFTQSPALNISLKVA